MQSLGKMRSRSVYPLVLVSLMSLTTLALTACGGRRTTGLVEPEDMAAESSASLTKENTALREKIKEQYAKIQTLETKLADVSQKSATSDAAAANSRSAHAGLPTAGVTHLPSEGVGESVGAIASLQDPEAGYVNDAPVQAYRRAMISRLSHDNAAAIVGFSQFVEKYPDHPLAGNAQFYIGEGYLAQKEPKLALKEFERVLTSYDRSPLVSMALLHAADIYDTQKQPEQAARTRQLLTSLFPQSPAAGILLGGKRSASVTTPGSATLAAPPAAAATNGTATMGGDVDAPPVQGKLDTPAPGALLSEPAPTVPLVVSPRTPRTPTQKNSAGLAPAPLDAPPAAASSGSATSGEGNE